MMRGGWTVRATRLTEAFDAKDLRGKNPEAILPRTFDARGTPRIHDGGKAPDLPPGGRVISPAPPATAAK